MTEGNSESALELESILARLTESQEALLKALDAADADRFAIQAADGTSIKRSLERTVDDLDLYYGALTASCLNLPQPPGLVKSEFSTLREGTMALQVTQGRFTNLLHDVLPQDLDKTATDERHATYTLRQVLEMTAAHFQLRVRQVETLNKPASTRA
ncbi:MAG: hypothetical protein IH957_11310 [Chloroflexi bacterium]|nr:hypothetical protein [Chloroflexota bacterium]